MAEGDVDSEGEALLDLEQGQEGLLLMVMIWLCWWLVVFPAIRACSGRMTAHGWTTGGGATGETYRSMGATATCGMHR